MEKIRDFYDSDLAAMLTKTGLLSDVAAERALKASKRTNTPLYRTILELGLVSEEVLIKALAEWLNVPLIENNQLDVALIKSFQTDRAFLERAEVAPIYEREDGSIVIATSNPRGNDALSSLSFHLGVKSTPALASRSTLKYVHEQLFDKEPANLAGHGADQDVERLQALANDGPVISQVNNMIAEAVTARASDIHIEAMEADARVRFRVDGVLRTHRRISLGDCATFTSRLKIMGRLNISEKRRPQDGRAQVSVQGRNIDLRLSTLPTQHGESVVVRVLDQSRMELNWQALGYPAERVTEIENIIRQPNGIFLVAGPTGSGKTTTLYTALTHINSEDRKIITVEDPIEYAIAGVSQVQVQPEIDMTFARALRAILRQDPDVVLIGEIRDEETAEIAVRAALVGRLVLSTVHTNDALSAVDRLLDLKVPPFLLAATLRGVLSQRLVRTVCSECSGAGCDACGATGLRGRSVISELMQINQAGQRELAQITGSSDLPDDASIRQFRRMSDVGEEMVATARTTDFEMARALGIGSG